MRRDAPWVPEVEVGVARAAALIDACVPELAPVALRPFSEGWDNVAFITKDDWVFRFPRRALAGELMADEVRVLPRLAPHLPVPISAPRWVGGPTEDYPWVFGGYRLLPGETACRARLSPAERVELAPALGVFLEALHRAPLSAEDTALVPPDRLRRLDLVRRKRHVDERLPKVSGLIGEAMAERVLAEYVRLMDTPPWQGPLVVNHGDLYARHLLVEREGGVRLSGVIDWGDVHRGDPACDLQIAYALLPASARPGLFRVYGEVDGATRDRARGRALYHCLALVYYGVEVGDEALRDEGVLGLGHALDP